LGNSFGDVEEESNLELSPLYYCEVEQFHVEALVHTKEGGDLVEEMQFSACIL